jgi:hypothetical protein
MGLRAGRIRMHPFAARSRFLPAFCTCVLIILNWFAPIDSSRAQSAADGAIAGHLLNESGSPMAFSLLLAIDPETGLVQKASTGGHGEFIIPRLPPGEYVLAVADSSVELPLPGLFAVHLGEVTEAEPRMIAGYTPRDLPTAESAELAALPVQDGGWNSLATTVPSVNPGLGNSVDRGEFTPYGVGSGQSTIRSDGASADDSFSGAPTGSGVAEDPEAGSDEPTDPAAGPGAGGRSLVREGRRAGSSYSFAQSAVREFRVHAQSDAAEYGSALYGHGAAAIVTSVSRSGGTRLHGMVLANIRDAGWTGANPFDISSTYNDGVITTTRVKPHDAQQQFAGRISGPFVTRSSGDNVASRISYLFAFERQLRDFPAISSPSSPQFYQLTAIQSGLLANRGVSASSTRAALNYLSSLTGPVPGRATQTIQFARLDWLRTAGARAVLEYNRVRWDNPRGTHSADVLNRGVASLGSSQGSIDDAVMRVFVFPTSRITNELRLQYGHELQYEAPQKPLPQEPAIGPGGFAPQVSIEPDGFLFGTPAALGRNAYPDERRLEATDVLAWTHGGHLIQLGGDFSELRDFTDSLSNPEGSFTYDSGTTGGHAGGLVDWITDFTFGVNSYPNGGCPSIFAARHDFCFRSFSQSFGAQNVTWHTGQWSVFFEDDWRVNRLLTVHLGARYERETLPAPQHPNRLLDAAFGRFATTSSFPEDGNNYGPRVGLAWQPLGAGRGTIRMGYGLYFGKVPGATIRAALLQTALPTSTTRIRITPTTETVCPQNPQVGFGYPCSFAAAPAGVTVAQSTSAMVFSRRFSLPAVQQGTLSLEHSVGWGVLGSASYVMNLDRQLPGSTDINIAPSAALGAFQLQGGTGQAGARDGETFYVPMYTGRISPSFGPVTEILSNANATYNAITLEAQRGLGGRAGLGGTGRGLEFRLAWTWSKALDFAPQSGATPRANGQFDPFTNRYDKSISALNFPHRIVATAVWSPRTVESAWARALLRDFSIAGIFTEMSGRGYSYTVFGGTRLSGGHESINGSGGSTVLPTMGRNTLRLPDTANLDLRVSRSFRMGSRFRIHTFADGFNLANRINYSGVTQRAYIAGVPGTGGAPAGFTPLVFQDANTIAVEGLNTLPFGTLTDAGTDQAPQRRIQIGLRIEF